MAFTSSVLGFDRFTHKAHRHTELDAETLNHLRALFEERLIANMEANIPKNIKIRSSSQKTKSTYLNWDDGDELIRKERAHPSPPVSSNLLNSLYKSDINQVTEHELMRTWCKSSDNLTQCEFDEGVLAEIYEKSGFKWISQILIKIESVASTGNRAQIVYTTSDGVQESKMINFQWSDSSIADLLIPVEIFTQGSDVKLLFDDINDGFDATQAITQISYVVVKPKTSGHSRKRRAASRDSCNPNKGCCKVHLGNLRKDELEDMAMEMFNKNQRKHIQVISEDTPIYTCYSKVAKCNLPTFANRKSYQDEYKHYNNYVGQIWHNKHNQQGFGGCCQADDWTKMKIVIYDRSHAKMFFKTDLVLNPTTCSCGVAAQTPTRRRRDA